MNATITRIPNPEHTRLVLDTRRALGIVPLIEGFAPYDSGSHAQRQDTAEWLGPQDGRAADAVGIAQQRKSS